MDFSVNLRMRGSSHLHSNTSAQRSATWRLACAALMSPLLCRASRWCSEVKRRDCVVPSVIFEPHHFAVALNVENNFTPLTLEKAIVWVSCEIAYLNQFAWLTWRVCSYKWEWAFAGRTKSRSFPHQCHKLNAHVSLHLTKITEDIWKMNH